MTLREKLERLKNEGVPTDGPASFYESLVDVALAADDLSFHDMGPLEGALSDAPSRLDKELG